jgi:hypothetical protein
MLVIWLARKRGCKDDRNTNDECYTTLEISYIIHTFRAITTLFHL